MSTADDAFKPEPPHGSEEITLLTYVLSRWLRTIRPVTKESGRLLLQPLLLALLQGVAVKTEEQLRSPVAQDIRHRVLLILRACLLRY